MYVKLGSLQYGITYTRAVVIHINADDGDFVMTKNQKLRFEDEQSERKQNQ